MATNGVLPDGLDAPEKLLKSLYTFNTLVKQVFSTNLTADLPTADDSQAVHAGFLGDLASQAGRLGINASMIKTFVETARNGGLTDDKKYLLEDIVKLAASLPSDSGAGKMLTNKFIDTLWNNLQHPPLTYLGDKYRFRQPDGSYNNRMYPELGKAGSPYARTVEPKIQLPPTLPDAGLIFDELMARGPKTKQHPNQISSMLFYVATIIIHDVFRTNSIDWNKVDNSSYLDLSPLYGNNAKEQDEVRQKKDGLLKPDAFAEIRLLGFPPGVSALLICFNRFHNYVATELKTINEGGRFTLKPLERMTPEQKDLYKTPEGLQNNELFQTARLITCGLYINVILIDYVRTILNLNQSHSEWLLDPRANPEQKYGPSGIPEGVGNAVSVEFNLIYRWHSTISDKDQKWTENFFQQVAKQLKRTVDPSTMDLTELKDVFKDFMHAQAKIPVGERTFEGLERQKDGSFKDADLIRLLTETTEDCAAAFGARQIPTVMRAISMLGIEQARSWNVATLNEFRQFFGMIPHKKFSDISSNPDVAQSLETLYGSPDLVELYPGLVVEDAKEPKYPGSGLCPGFTISKAILADAVALVRGDRFYTVDFTAAYLTNWGFTQTTSNPQIAGGGVMYKLLHRAFPGWYRGASVYAMYPLTTPAKTKEILTKLGTVKNYDFSRPSFQPQPTEIKTWHAITKVLADHDNYKVPWGPHTSDMTGHDYMLSGDTPANRAQHAFVYDAIYKPSDGMNEVCKLYEKITMDLMRARSRRLRSGFQLDVVADIANTSHAMAVAQLFHMPIKMPGMTVGPLNPQQFYTIMSVLFAYVFLDVDDAKSYELRMGAKQGAAAIGKVVEAVVSLVQHDKIHELFEWVGKATGMRKEDIVAQYGAKLIKRFSEGGKSVEEVTWALVPTMAAAVGTQAQGLAQVLNMLLDDKYYHHWAVIRALGKSKDPADFEKLEKYALECLRLQTSAFGLVRNAAVDGTIQDGKTTINVKKGDQIFTNFVAAGLDPEVFHDPEEIKLDRDPKLYIHHGWGVHACIGRNIVTHALATQLKCLSKLKNLRRAPGGQGEMKYKVVNGAFKVYMKTDWSDYWPFPTTMKVLHDGIEEW